MKFDTEEEQIVSKEQEQKIQLKKKVEKVNTNKKSIDKGKLIALSVFGAIALIFIIILSVSYSSDEKEKKVTEIETPESEVEKYNSKIDAVESNNKDNTQRNVNLTETFGQTKEQKEATAEQLKLEENMKNMDNGKKTNNSPPLNNNTSNIDNVTRSNNNYRNTQQNTKTQNTSRNTNGQTTIISEKTSDVEKMPIVKAKTRTTREQEDADDDTNTFFKNKNQKKSTSVNSKQTDEIIYASVHTNQQIMDGQRVKLRLTKTTIIDGEKYPLNTICYGIARIKPNRIEIKVSTVNQTPVKLEVYDAEDSDKGIYILTPNLNAEIKKEAQNNALSDDELTKKIPFSKTLTAIFQRKVKEERVELLNNYKLIIKAKTDNE